MLCLLSISCNQTVDFQIENETDQKIEDITIKSSFESEAPTLQLLPNSSTFYSHNMGTARNTDGRFEITYTIEGRHYKKRFGNHSNGITLADVNIIRIQPDTVIFNHLID